MRFVLWPFKARQSKGTEYSGDLSLAAALLSQGRVCQNRESALRLAEDVLRSLLHATSASCGCIALIPPGQATLRSEIAVSRCGEWDVPECWPDGETLVGRAVTSSEACLLTRGRRTDGTWQRAGLPEGTTAALVVPLIDVNRDNETMLMGVMILMHRETGGLFRDSDLTTASLLAGNVTTALRTAEKISERQTRVLNTVQEIGRQAVERHEAAQGHSRRVAEVCARVASHMGLDTWAIEILRRGALLHEIGKIGIPDSILHKPIRLTEEEMEQLRRYPLLGYELCASLDLDPETLMLIRNHTERLDGSGYPDGLEMSQIPVPVRILAIADAFDSMSSSRSYRPDMGHRERNEQLNRFAGSQFDPTVVEALKALWSQGSLDDLYQTAHSASLSDISLSETSLPSPLFPHRLEDAA